MAQPLNILCFGDSLTAGYSSWGMVFTPYSEVLTSCLETHFGDAMSVKTTTDGVSGEMVVQGFKARMKGQCKRAFPSMLSTHSPSIGSNSKSKKMLFDEGEMNGDGRGKVSSFASKLLAKGIKPPEKAAASSPSLSGIKAEHSTETDANDAYKSEDPYDWVIFLGGTNDLGRGMPVHKIFSEIKAVTQIPLDAGARVLILTVPECHAVNYSLDKRRDELNDLIKNDKRENIYNLDLRTLLPFHSMPVEERDLIWDDGLHFKPAGYARIGTLVASALISIMDPSAAVPTSSSSSSGPKPQQENNPSTSNIPISTSNPPISESPLSHDDNNDQATIKIPESSQGVAS